MPQLISAQTESDTQFLLATKAAANTAVTTPSEKADWNATRTTLALSHILPAPHANRAIQSDRLADKLKLSKPQYRIVVCYKCSIEFVSTIKNKNGNVK